MSWILTIISNPTMALTNSAILPTSSKGPILFSEGPYTTRVKDHPPTVPTFKLKFLTRCGHHTQVLRITLSISRSNRQIKPTHTQVRPPHTVSLLGEILPRQTLLEFQAPRITTDCLTIQLHLHTCCVHMRLLSHLAARPPCFRPRVSHPPRLPRFTARHHLLYCSLSLHRSLFILHRLYLSSSFSLKTMQNQVISQYSYRDQAQFFREAVSLPMSPGAGDFVPQQMYRPHTNSDRRRYVEEVQLEPPIYFWMENPSECGIPLIDALHSRVRRLENRDETVFAGRGPSISVRIQVSDNRTYPNMLGPHSSC